MSKSNYTFVGVTTNKGVQRVCYANSMGRVKVLERNGHTGVQLVPMPYEGEREDAVNHLLGLEQFKGIPCVLDEARNLGFTV